MPAVYCRVPLMPGCLSNALEIKDGVTSTAPDSKAGAFPSSKSRMTPWERVVSIMAAGGAGVKKKGKGVLDQEQIILQFNQMRQECRGIIGKIGELEMEVNEHSIVVDALKSVEPERRCFRMIGGVLVERTVKDVLPALENNKQQITGLISKLKESLTAKERELAAFRDKHNIHVRGEKENAPEENIQASDKAAGVLVAQENS